MPILRKLRTSSGFGSVDIDAYNISSASQLDYSESFAADNADEIGLLILNGAATATGTGAAMTASLEVSPDGGTSWFNSPIAINTTTQFEVVCASITPAAEFFGYSWAPLAPSGSKSKPLYRFAFTYANADNDVAGITMWLSVRNRNQWRQ